MTDSPPRIDDAPGLKWRPRAKGGWHAYWICRGDVVARGYETKTVRLMAIEGEVFPPQVLYVQDRCRRLQAEMLAWANGNIPQVGIAFDGTLRGLIWSYRHDPISRYRKIRYQTRLFYDRLMNRLEREHGNVALGDVEYRDLLLWHEAWTGGGKKIAVAHSMVSMLRTLINFGLTAIENGRHGGECGRLSLLLRNTKFSQAPARGERLTADQATAIRKRAFESGRGSIAMAQAIQFEGMLRQKDVIGEWVPVAEEGISDLTFNGEKWLRGIRWEEVKNMVLRHVTSKRQKPMMIDLREAPMVMEELARQYPAGFPSSGPVIVSEVTGLPYHYAHFLTSWRKIATEVGVPKGVRNMDTRAGAISEATDAGAPLEHVRHAATHSDISMTQRYSRGGEEKTAEVQHLRVIHRNKAGTKGA